MEMRVPISSQKTPMEPQGLFIGNRRYTNSECIAILDRVGITNAVTGQKSKNPRNFNEQNHLVALTANVVNNDFKHFVQVPYNGDAVIYLGYTNSQGTLTYIVIFDYEDNLWNFQTGCVTAKPPVASMNNLGKKLYTTVQNHYSNSNTF